MKKLVSLFMVIALVTGVCPALAEDGEILFRGIPWGSNLTDVIANLPSYSASGDFDWECRVREWNSNQIDYDKPLTPNGVCPIVAYYGDIQVAGYAVNTISMKFLFTVDDTGVIHRDEQSLSLFSAAYDFTVTDVDTAAKDLIIKLSELYGDGEYGTHEYGDTSSKTVTWYGDKNTGVCLEYTDTSIVIWYGKTDTTAIESLDIALAKEEAANAVDNTDGL